MKIVTPELIEMLVDSDREALEALASLRDPQTKGGIAALSRLAHVALDPRRDSFFVKEVARDEATSPKTVRAIVAKCTARGLLTAAKPSTAAERRSAWAWVKRLRATDEFVEFVSNQNLLGTHLLQAITGATTEAVEQKAIDMLGAAYGYPVPRPPDFADILVDISREHERHYEFLSHSAIVGLSHIYSFPLVDVKNHALRNTVPRQDSTLGQLAILRPRTTVGLMWLMYTALNLQQPFTWDRLAVESDQSPRSAEEFTRLAVSGGFMEASYQAVEGRRPGRRKLEFRSTEALRDLANQSNWLDLSLMTRNRESPVFGAGVRELRGRADALIGIGHDRLQLGLSVDEAANMAGLRAEMAMHLGLQACASVEGVSLGRLKHELIDAVA